MLEKSRSPGRGRKMCCHAGLVANLDRLNEFQAGPLDRLIERVTRFSRQQWILEQVRQIEARDLGHPYLAARRYRRAD